MKESELLAESAQYISEHGHTKGRYRDDEGRVCALGAMRTIKIKHDMFSYEACLTYENAFFALADYLHEGIPRWNDRPETTSEDVILAMKTVSHDLAEQGY